MAASSSLINHGPQELDSLRALLSSLANRGTGESVPVSIVALQHELRRRSASHEIVDALYLLSDIRDAQHLGRGFWLPTPSHTVPFTGFHLLVSGLPNQELTRLYACLFASPGASRLLLTAPGNALPQGSPLKWLGAPESTLEWTRGIIDRAKLTEPHGLEGAEIFRSWRGESGSRWSGLNLRRLPSAKSQLIRFRAANGQVSYYLLSVVSGKILGMSELALGHQEIRRMQFGLRILYEDPGIFWFVREESQGWMLLDVPPLPPAERRLLSALGTVDEEMKPGRWQAKVPFYADQALVKVLESLGLKNVSR